MVLQLFPLPLDRTSEEMKIDDKRCTSSWVPAVEILNEVIPFFREQNFAGIRRIVLLDQDYHKGSKALGRYCAVAGTNRADVELYFEWYNELPEELRESKLYLTYMIVRLPCVPRVRHAGENGSCPAVGVEY